MIVPLTRVSSDFRAVATSILRDGGLVLVQAETLVSVISQ